MSRTALDRGAQQRQQFLAGRIIGSGRGGAVHLACALRELMTNPAFYVGSIQMTVTVRGLQINGLEGSSELCFANC
jgi:hypothetical protein